MESTAAKASEFNDSLSHLLIKSLMVFKIWSCFCLGHDSLLKLGSGKVVGAFGIEALNKEVWPESGILLAGLWQ